MHACIHTCIHTYIHTYIHIYIHAYVHTYVYACVHACMHACVHACMHACMHVCMCREAPQLPLRLLGQPSHQAFGLPITNRNRAWAPPAGRQAPDAVPRRDASPCQPAEPACKGRISRATKWILWFTLSRSSGHTPHTQSNARRPTRYRAGYDRTSRR